MGLRTGTERLRPQPGDTTELIVTPGGNARWTQPWRWVPPQGGKPGEVRLEAGPRFRFYAGQPDPADPSHFTIDHDLNDVRGKIHGRLKDDGTVELKPEAGTFGPPHWDPLDR